DPLPEGAIARLGTNRFRHFSGIGGLAYSKDGKHLAVVGGPGFSVINVADGKTVYRYREPIAPSPPTFHSIAYSHDCQLLAAGSYGQVLLFDAKTFKRIETIESRGYGLRFSANSQKLVTFNHDGFSVWDRKSRKISRQEFAEKAEDLSEILQIAISPDCKI